MSKILDAFEAQKSNIRVIISKYRPNPADVEELVQEVFLAGIAAETRAEIREPERLLLRIAKFIAISEARKKINTTSKSIEDFENPTDLLDEAQHTPEDILDGRQKLFIYSQALASLSPELRRAFLMRRLEELKFKQIATRLGVSVSTVEKRVASAFLQCNAYLREHGHDPAEFVNAGRRKGPSKAKNRTKRSQDT